MHSRRTALLLWSICCLTFALASIASGAAEKPAAGKGLSVTPTRWTKPGGAALATKQAAPKATVFSDNFDGTFPGTNWSLWNDDSASDPNWGPTTYRRYGASGKGLYCAQSGPNNGGATHLYPNNVDGTWVTYGPFSTSGVTDGTASFMVWVNTENGFDYMRAGWSLDDESYEGLQWTGSSGGWISAQVSLNNASFTTDYTGRSQVWFSFWFVSDYSITYEGVYVDDFRLTTGATPGINSLVQTSGGTPVQGVLMTLSGNSTYAYTAANGRASLRPNAGTYTVRPKKAGYTFVPSARTVTFGNSPVAADFTARVATGDGVTRYWGLCVGIERYQQINNLTYCVDDAVEMRASLIACGWPAANIMVLQDSQATKAGIKTALETQMAKADADDVFLYFHSSHGAQDADLAPQDETDNLDEYLCTYDTGASPSSMIRDDELGVWLAALKTRKYVVMIDTCHSGGMIRSASAGGSAGGFDFAQDITRSARASGMTTQDLDDNSGGVVITASRHDEYSAEDPALRNGVFAYFVLEGLDTGGADLDHDRYFTAEEIYQYVAAPTHAYNPGQTVDFYDGYPGGLRLARLQTLMKTTTPARNATNVSRTADIVVTWRYPVNQASAQDRFKLKNPSNKVVAGTFSWTTPNRVMRFNPSSTLLANARYTVVTLPGLQASGGDTFWYADTFKFTTAGVVAALAMQATSAPAANGRSQITVNLTSAATVSATVCNLAGRTIAVLPAQELAAGMSTLLWDGKNTAGARVPAGQYLIRLQAADGQGNNASCLTPLRQ